MTTTRDSTSVSSSIDELSLQQIRGAKQARRRELFEETDNGTMRVKQGEDTGSLPWLRSIVLGCRGSVCFRTCVAREPETPLTELHLAQPVLGLLLLLAVIMLLVTTAVAAAAATGRGLAILCAVLAAAASTALLCVGLIARGVPSQEALNVQLSRRFEQLGDAIADVGASADDAGRLEGMTLGWVRSRGADRSALRELNAQIARDTAALWAFQFKATLLLYLSRGEKQRFQQDNAHLLDELRTDPNATLAQYEAQRERLLPNGRLTVAELRRIADVVRQTEHESAYDFLDEVIYSLCERLEVETSGQAEEASWSYAWVVEAVYGAASAPPFAERFAAFSQDGIAKQHQQHQQHQRQSGAAAFASAAGPEAVLVELPPSPPPSPPPMVKVAGGASRAIGAFVFVESNKSWLLREAWKAGALLVSLSALLMVIALATGAGAQWVALIGAVIGVTAALLGWWVCNNKKNDLVMMRALVRFEAQLLELDAAEERLKVALETMLAADTDMQKLTADITAATGEAKAQLAAIREHNERAARGTRRGVLDSVLVDLADDDGSLMMDPVQRRKLLRLIAHMAGRGADELSAFYGALGLKYAAKRASGDLDAGFDAAIDEPPPSPGSRGFKRHASTWRDEPSERVGFVVHKVALDGDDPREYSTKEILDQLEELGAFEIIMGLRTPGEGGGHAGGSDGGSEQENAHEWMTQARSNDETKRKGARGSSRLPSEVLPLAVVEEDAVVETPRRFGAFAAK